LLNVRKSKKSLVNLSRRLDDAGCMPASMSLGDAWELFELLGMNEEKRDKEGATVDAGENFDLSIGMSR
jgi:hypothetical protein